MVNDNNIDLNRVYVYLSRRVAEFMIRQLTAVENDAWNDDETGVLDRMNPELDEANWMSAVIRLLSTIRNILEYNSDNPIQSLILDGLVENDENNQNNGNT